MNPTSDVGVHGVHGLPGTFPGSALRRSYRKSMDTMDTAEKAQLPQRCRKLLTRPAGAAGETKSRAKVVQK